MRRPPKRTALDAFSEFLGTWILAEVTYANALRQVALLAVTAGYASQVGITREDFVVFNPKLFGRPRGAVDREQGH